MDEVGCFVDGSNSYTLDFAGNWEHAGEIAFTNSSKLRFTNIPFGNALGEFGPLMTVVRELEPKEHRAIDELFSQNPYKEDWENDEDLDELFEDPEVTMSIL